MYEKKDAGGDPTNEPEVVKAVQAEIAKLGENTKANYEELRKNHETLKKLVDEKGASMDAETKAQITKLSEDITTRQDNIDKKVADAQAAIKAEIDTKMNELATKRIDAIETALKRLPGEMPGAKQEMAGTKAEARDFFINAKAAKSKGDEDGAGYKWVAKLDEALDGKLDEYKTYGNLYREFLRMPDIKLITPDNLKALEVGIDPFGGYTVTPVMMNRIVKRLYEMDPIRQLATVESITTGAAEWIVDWGDAESGWEGETETGAKTGTPEFYKKRIPIHTMYAKPKATQTVIEDSGINIENWLADKVTNRFNRREGVAFVQGAGTNTPRGFLTYPDGTNFGQIERVGMLHATQVTADGYIKVKYSLIEQYLNRGTWLMNRLTVADTMYLKTGAGEYIWKPGLSEEKFSSILGLPVRMSTSMPLTGTAANLAVALADWAEAYTIVDRLGITVQRDPYTSKPYVEYYTRKRLGADVMGFQAIKLGRMSVA